MLLKAFPVIALLVVFSTHNSHSSSDVVFTKVETFYNPDFFSSFFMTIKPKTPGPILDVDMKVIHNFSNTESPASYFNVFRKQTNGNYRSLLILNFNYCAMFGDKSKTSLGMNVENLLKVWVATIKKYSNFPKCPLLAGDYSIKNLHIGEKIIPAFVVPGKYQLLFENYLKVKDAKVVLRNATINVILKRRK